MVGQPHELVVVVTVQHIAIAIYLALFGLPHAIAVSMVVRTAFVVGLQNSIQFDSMI